MIAGRAEPAALATLVETARHRGFVGLALDGADVLGAIGSERDARLLEKAVAIAQHRRESLWAEHLARRACEIDPDRGGLRLAAILVSLGRCEEAERLLAGVRPGLDDHLCHQLRGVLCAKLGQAAQAMAIFNALPGRSRFGPAPIVLSTVQEMLEWCVPAQLEPLLERLVEAYPEHVLIRSFSLRFHALLGDRVKARALAELSDNTLKRAPSYARRAFAEAVADSLELPGWTNQLFDFVREAIAKDPTHWSLYDRAARAARAARREKEFAAIVETIQAGNRKTAEASAVLCRWLVDENRLDEASKLLSAIRPLSAEFFLQAQLYLTLYDHDQDRVNAAFDDCVRCGIPLLGPAVSYGIHTYYYNCSPARLRHCLAKLEPFTAPPPADVNFWQIYLRCLIATDQEGEARERYAALPRGLANGAALKPFGMFFDARDKRDDKARKDWTDYIRDTRHLCVNAPSSYPRTVRLKYSETDGGVLLFVTLFNAMDYLDSFLAHYRELGVDHFFVIDNGSSDGSLDRLSQEPDVSVFSNRESFAASAFGVLWINHLMQRFGVDHWCFHVDIDEYFVFPDCAGSRTLRDLLSYCDDYGFGCVTAIELDMYPECLDTAPDTDPFAASCYFDANCSFTETELPPYVMIQGGIRERLTGLALSMQKTPLIRVAPDVRYIECNHSATHLPVADVTGALLHYKFVGDMRRRVGEAISRAEHFAGAISYRRLDSALGSIARGKSLLSPGSCRYDGPAVLLHHGLIKSSAGWGAFQMQHLREKIADSALGS
jgi:Glycosyl transferase family 2